MGVRADGTAESLVVILQDLAPLQELGRAASLPDLARGELAAPGSCVGDSQAQHRSAVVVERSATVEPSVEAAERSESYGAGAVHASAPVRSDA